MNRTVPNSMPAMAPAERPDGRVAVVSADRLLRPGKIVLAMTVEVAVPVSILEALVSVVVILFGASATVFDTSCRAVAHAVTSIASAFIVIGELPSE